MRLDLRNDFFCNCLLIFIVSANLLFGRSIAILNGQSAELGQFPFTVYVKNSGKTCTGIILSPTRVLTAAHCVCTEYGETTVLAGVIDITNKGSAAQEVVVQSTQFEPNYATTMCSLSNFLPPNDLAILTLKSPLSLSENVGAATLDCAAPKTGTATVIGFGTDQTSSGGILRYTEANYHGCMDNFYFCSDLSQTQIAPGDSGGPMTAGSGGVMGVILGQDVDVNIYSDLSSYCTWINQ